jgi:DNA-binding HxlR family transcriptional regulator
LPKELDIDFCSINNQPTLSFQGNGAAVGQRARAGARALGLLARPINVAVLEALSTGTSSLEALGQAAGLPSQSTLRVRLRELAELDVIQVDRGEEFPRPHIYGLAPSGRELLRVADVARTWLADCPQGPVELGTPKAKGTIKALAQGWSSAILRALAAKPLSLTELDGLIPGVNYPSLERRLTTMTRVGQVERLPGTRPGTQYAVTEWLRRGAAPLAAATRWERAHLPRQTAPIARLDVEATFLLTVPLLRPAQDLEGSCRLAVESPGGEERRRAGVRLDLRQGRVVSCVTTLEGDVAASASGPATAWLRAVLEHDRKGLELGGDCCLAAAVIDGLHEALLGRRQPAGSLSP